MSISSYGNSAPDSMASIVDNGVCSSCHKQICTTYGVYAPILVVLSCIFSEIWQDTNNCGGHLKFKMAARYHVDSIAIGSKLHMNQHYRIVCSFQFV